VKMEIVFTQVISISHQSSRKVFNISEATLDRKIK